MGLIAHVASHIFCSLLITVSTMFRYIYERRAALALGRDPKFLGVPFAAEWIRQRGHSMKTTLDAIVGTVNMAGIQQEAEQGLESGQLTEASAEAFLEAKKGQITDSLWKLNVLDMEGTLTRVVDRVRQHSEAFGYAQIVLMCTAECGVCERGLDLNSKNRC